VKSALLASDGLVFWFRGIKTALIACLLGEFRINKKGQTSASLLTLSDSENTSQKNGKNNY
jgi:hypothetical protein